jgi:hypothetical protein
VLYTLFGKGVRYLLGKSLPREPTERGLGKCPPSGGHFFFICYNKVINVISKTIWQIQMMKKHVLRKRTNESNKNMKTQLTP